MRHTELGEENIYFGPGTIAWCPVHCSGWNTSSVKSNQIGLNSVDRHSKGFSEMLIEVKKNKDEGTVLRGRGFLLICHSIMVWTIIMKGLLCLKMPVSEFFVSSKKSITQEN